MNTIKNFFKQLLPDNENRKIGYARISRKEQKLDLQLDALQTEKCEKIFQETISGFGIDRPQFKMLAEQLREGDVVVVWKLDRLGRSVKTLIRIAEIIQEKGATIKCITDPFIDFTTSAGIFNYHIAAARIEYEVNIIRERTKAGLVSARARGRGGGRPKGLSAKAKEKAIQAEKMYKERKLSVKEMCEILSISKMTFYNYLRHRNVKLDSEQ